MTKQLQKGFTLIELLVVIAIIGILAAVVLVAINPAQRIAEANDSKVKSDVGQVATALESCYTANNGSYTNCVNAGKDTAALVTGGYLKQAISGITVSAVGVSGVLTATSAVCPSGTGTKNLVYRTSTGATGIECPANPAL